MTLFQLTPDETVILRHRAFISKALATLMTSGLLRTAAESGCHSSKRPAETGRQISGLRSHTIPPNSALY